MKFPEIRGVTRRRMLVNFQMKFFESRSSLTLVVIQQGSKIGCIGTTWQLL
jgi:hypothetical protein